MGTHRMSLVAIAAMLSLLPAMGTAAGLSMAKAVETTLNANPSIAASRLSAESAKFVAKSAKFLTNPEFTVSPNIVGEGGSDAAILITQPLELNGARRVRGQIASSQYQAAISYAATVRRQTVLQLTQTYWDVVGLQELMKLHQQNIGALRQLQTAVQKQLDIGTVPGSQLLKTELEMTRAEQGLAQVVFELTQAKALVNTIMGRSTGDDFTATDAPQTHRAALDKPSLMASAQKLRPELSAIDAQLLSARGEVQARRLRSAPDVSLQARKGSFESDGDEGIAISLSLPIVDWGSAKADVQQAQTSVRNLELQRLALQNTVGMEVEQAINAVTTSRQAVDQFNTHIISKSEELLRMAQTGYEKGATGYLEVLEAQRTLLDAKTEYTTVLVRHTKAVAELEWACGMMQLDQMEAVK